ncbi:MFS transporter [Colwellia psychrerythraea]|uniref:Major facilitator superfamily MFS_1 n=1 Tax=Colwellia psychrerythraea TaxID=28229 RepID=A0A099KPM1_COLPS|nr:MFS transporter [Colwellia psychrerythraea]KGJ91882.1 major facilitator superfamily MFS_1 [Colwellia psychrerythraea]
MSNVVSVKRFKQFPQLMWILLFGSFITRGSYYMVWPFLAVILYEKFALSATNVGLILSSAAVISVFVSFVGSALSDRIGRHQLMYASGVLYIISFSLLAQVDSITGYALVITLCSIATALWRPLTSALIGDIIDDKTTRELAMQSLYFVVNVGCAVGPMLGLWMGLTGEQSSFYITAGAFAFLLALLWCGFHQHNKLANENELTANQELTKLTADNREIDSVDIQCQAKVKAKSAEGNQIINVLVADKLLQCLIFANILCMFIYAQMDSSLIQYLTRAEVPDLLQLISSMIFTNALVIISTQFLLLKLMANLSLVSRIQIGLVLLMCSQIWLAVNPLTLFWGWIGAIVVMSLAETILFPTMNVHIDRLAPDHLRGAYFGAASFYEFGYAIAPLGGGIILDQLGGPWLFFITAALTLIVMYLYSTLDKMPRPDFTNVLAVQKRLSE